uniref:Uncharacterized protein n=1 Tax=Rhizophora mucronata TaxID=61149 RepID=A0A2P2PUE2_RHIMU
MLEHEELEKYAASLGEFPDCKEFYSRNSVMRCSGC